MACFQFHDLGSIPYADALELQTTAFDKLVDSKTKGGGEKNHLFFCEQESNLLIPESLLREKGITFYHVSRGGDITYHGPGQITGYPVFDLECWNMGLRQYIYNLEEIMIRFLALYGLKGERLDGATGVWLDPLVKGRARKICAIGVRSSHFVTMHGFALNINTDLSYFSYINPCGFTDKGVTSLARELGEEQDFNLAKRQLRELFELFF